MLLGHGTSACYDRGCRREECVAAARREAIVRQAARVMRSGREPAVRVPAVRARRHVLELVAAGMSQNEVARRAGIGAMTVSRIIRGGRNCTAIVERLVLAVDPLASPRDRWRGPRPHAPAVRPRGGNPERLDSLHAEIAVGVCATSPSRLDCLADALDDERHARGRGHGIRGGLTPDQRRALLRAAS